MATADVRYQSTAYALVLVPAALCVHGSVLQRCDHGNADFFSEQVVNAYLEQNAEMEECVCNAPVLGTWESRLHWAIQPLPHSLSRWRSHHSKMQWERTPLSLMKDSC